MTPVDAVPEVIEPAAAADYLEVMTRAVFQAGVRWKHIADRWEEYRQAFAGFDPQQVAHFGELDVERILATPGVLRARRKVEATIRNARALLDAEAQFGSFAAYLRAFDSYRSLADDIKRRFAFMGEMNVWYFLFRIGERVPRFEQWVATIPGDHPRMREMVDAARAAHRSREEPPA